MNAIEKLDLMGADLGRSPYDGKWHVSFHNWSVPIDSDGFHVSVFDPKKYGDPNSLPEVMIDAAYERWVKLGSPEPRTYTEDEVRAVNESLKEYRLKDGEELVNKLVDAGYVQVLEAQ